MHSATGISPYRRECWRGPGDCGRWLHKSRLFAISSSCPALPRTSEQPVRLCSSVLVRWWPFGRLICSCSWSVPALEQHFVVEGDLGQECRWARSCVYRVCPGLFTDGGQTRSKLSSVSIRHDFSRSQPEPGPSWLRTGRQCPL